MKVFADLEISGDPDTLVRALAEIEAALRNGWSRSKELEGRSSSRLPARCFVCTETSRRRAASLWLVQRDGGRAWWVSNIVPREVSSLSQDEYNTILDEFRTSFLDPVATRLHLAVEVGKTNKGLEDWMTKAAADALLTFSRSANKSTGSGHPFDRERWFNFLVQIHRDRRAPPASVLRRWLIEEEQWPPEVATDLTIEYETALGLLKHYDAR